MWSRPENAAHVLIISSANSWYAREMYGRGGGCLSCLSGMRMGHCATVLRIEFYKQSAQVFFFLPHSDAMVDAASCLFPIFMLMLRFQVPSSRGRNIRIVLGLTA